MKTTTCPRDDRTIVGMMRESKHNNEHGNSSTAAQQHSLTIYPATTTMKIKDAFKWTNKQKKKSMKFHFTFITDKNTQSKIKGLKHVPWSEPQPLKDLSRCQFDWWVKQIRQQRSRVCETHQRCLAELDEDLPHTYSPAHHGDVYALYHCSTYTAY